MSLVQFRPEAPDAGVAHLVERHLAKVEVASSSLVTRSKTNKERTAFLISYSVPWPSGKARVCKTLTPQFKSGRHLQKPLLPGAAAFSFLLARLRGSLFSPLLFSPLLPAPRRHYLFFVRYSCVPCAAVIY